MSTVEISVHGDEIWGHALFEGEICGRGGIYKGRIESEDDALDICHLVREALAPDVIRRVMNG